MLPDERATPELLAIRAELDARSDDWLADCPPLLRRDVSRVGACVIGASEIELHLRRAVETFAVSGHLPARHASKTEKIRPADLVETVETAALQLATSVWQADLYRRRFADIEHCRRSRNLFAHAAARRVPGRDAVVFFLKSERDAERLLGGRAGLDQAFTAIVPDASIAKLALAIRGHVPWLAAQVAEWNSALR